MRGESRGVPGKGRKEVAALSHRIDSLPPKRTRLKKVSPRFPF